MNTTPRRWLIFCCAVSAVLSCLWCFYEFGWEPVVVSFGSLTALIGLLFFPNNSAASPLQGFSAGKRLKWCRTQFRLTASEMAEKLLIESESLYRSMEAEQCDVPKEVLTHLSQISGISIEWLKHGHFKDELRRTLWDLFPRIAIKLNLQEPQWQAYEIQNLSFYNKQTVTACLKKVLSTKPDQLYFAINPDCCGSVYLISQRNEHYCLWDLHALDFWHEYAWASDLNYIPYLYTFYHVLIKREEIDSQGIFLNEGEMRSLYLGNCSPENIIRSAWIREHHSKQFSNIRHWPEDLLDYQHKRSPASNYKAWYGDWIIKAQEYFKRYIESHHKKRQDRLKS